MRIAGKEFLKVISHPMLWILTFLFLLVNFVLFYGYAGNADARRHFHRLHDTVLDYGINLRESNPEFDRNDEMAEFYLKYVDIQSRLYDNLDMYAILEMKQERWNYYPEGAYDRFLKKNYEKLQKRLEEIKVSGEGCYGFYPGTGSQIHSLLYNVIVGRLMLEMPLLMMLSVLYLMDYERFHKTRDIVIGTKTGKGIMCHKIIVGVGTGLLFGAILSAGTFGMFFYCVPFQGLWEVPVSSAMLAEQRPYGLYPFITFWRLNVGEYFILALTVLALLLIVVGGLTAGLQLLLQNSYITFSLKIMLYMVLYLIVPGGFTSFADVLICLNPSALWICAGGWFMENELILSFPGNEFWCIGLWAAIAAAGIFLGRRRYLRLEIS